MISANKIYCIDANVLIVAWEKYYAPDICPSYWEKLNGLGKQGRIFIPAMVYQEIVRTDDQLAAWLKSSDIPVKEITSNVTSCLAGIYAKDEKHKLLVDNTKGRSLADPWMIAHAMDMNACVVTKENLETAANSKRIKIPNVCVAMGVDWVDDFGFIRAIGLKFACGF